MNLPSLKPQDYIVPFQDSMRKFTQQWGVIPQGPHHDEMMKDRINRIQGMVLGGINPAESAEAKFGSALREAGNKLEQVAPNKYVFKGTPLNAASDTALPEFEQSATNPRKLLRK